MSAEAEEQSKVVEEMNENVFRIKELSEANLDGLRGISQLIEAQVERVKDQQALVGHFTV